jgi:hypothetical protein
MLTSYSHHPNRDRLSVYFLSAFSQVNISTPEHDAPSKPERNAPFRERKTCYLKFIGKFLHSHRNYTSYNFFLLEEKLIPLVLVSWLILQGRTKIFFEKIKLGVTLPKKHVIQIHRKNNFFFTELSRKILSILYFIFQICFIRFYEKLI